MTQTSRQLYQMVREVRPENFNTIALELFRYQAKANPVFREYLQLLGIVTSEEGLKHIQKLADIPFLPIELFKNYKVKTAGWNPELEFSSSGTTGSTPSRHFIRSHSWYQEQARNGFTNFYGDPSDYCFLALLPHYLDRKGSSLVQMVQDFIQLSKYEQSGFFLRDQQKLVEQLNINQQEKIPTVLIGVSFALWDLAEQFPMDLSGIILMETGGMKGQRKELIREELHQIFKDAFQLDAIHSEYGMTELLSQGYSKGDGRFFSAPTMKILLSDITDPFNPPVGNQGQLKVIDLANIDSCSFIQTEDIGRLHSDGSFEVLGRLDRASWRGCNLMIS